MSLTITEARDEMLTLFKDAWEADVTTAAAPIVWTDAPDDNNVPNPETNDIWCRATVIHTVGRNSAIGNKLFDREGVVTIQIFTRYGAGLANNDLACKVALDAFQGKSTSGGVWFRNVTLNEIGHDGDWFQSNVLANFEYTERL